MNSSHCSCDLFSSVCTSVETFFKGSCMSCTTGTSTPPLRGGSTTLPIYVHACSRKRARRAEWSPACAAEATWFRHQLQRTTNLSQNGSPSHFLFACTLRNGSGSYVHVSPRPCFENLSMGQTSTHQRRGPHSECSPVLSCPPWPCYHRMCVIAKRLGCLRWLEHAADHGYF